MTLKEVKMQLLNDRKFLATVILENNPVAVAERFQQNGISIGTNKEMVDAIISLLDQGKEDLALNLIDVPWIPGDGDPMVELALEYLGYPMNQTKALSLGSVLSGVVGFIQGFTGYNNADQQNQQAAQQAQLIAAQQAAIQQAQVDQNRKMIIWAIVILVIMVVIYFIYKRFSK